MKSEWKKCKLKDICSFSSNRINVSELNNDTYISTENMLPNKEGIKSATTLPTVAQTPSYSINDVLVSNIRPYFKKIWYANQAGGCSNDVLVFRANIDVDPHYLYYVLADDKFFEYSMSTSKGTKMPRGDKQALMDYGLSLPPLAEQKKIAYLLKILDDKIELNTRINKNLEEQANLIFEQLYSHSAISTIRDFATTIESGSRPKGGAEATGIPSIGAEKIERFGIYDYSSEKYISEEYFSKMNRGIVNDGDVLLYKDGAYTGKSSMSLDGFPHNKCAVNEHVFILRTDKNKYQSYLYFCLSKNEIKENIHSLASGKAAQPGLNQKELSSIEIHIPSTIELDLFENQISPFMHQIAQNALENKKLAQLRDTLLPQLMSGQLDVSNITF